MTSLETDHVENHYINFHDGHQVNSRILAYVSSNQHWISSYHLGQISFFLPTFLLENTISCRREKNGINQGPFFKCCAVDCLVRTRRANCLKTLLYRTERGPESRGRNNEGFYKGNTFRMCYTHPHMQDKVSKMEVFAVAACSPYKASFFYPAGLSFKCRWAGRIDGGPFLFWLFVVVQYDFIFFFFLQSL